MLDEKDLLAIAQLIDKKLDAKLAQQKQEIMGEVAGMMEQHTARIELKLENEVTRKIESLFDGYQLTHEKQWELERKLAQLERRIEELEIRAG